MSALLGTLALVAFICIPLWLATRNEKPTDVPDWTVVTVIPGRLVTGQTYTVYDASADMYVCAARHPSGCVQIWRLDPEDCAEQLAEELLRGVA